MQDFKAKAYIDLSAIIHNAKQIKKACSPAKFCAVVKADAYGHGMVEVAHAIKGLTDYFAVGTVGEGVLLRQSGITNPILCLLPDFDLHRAQFYNLDITIAGYSHAREIARYASESGKRLNVHLAINTGMNRFGVDNFGEINGVLRLINNSNLNLIGAYSHFYNVQSKRCNNEQLKSFLNACTLVKQNYKNALFHISSGGGLAYGDKYKLDMVRVGLMLYGYKSVSCGLKLKRAMTLRGDKFLTRELKSGSSLLYGDFKLGQNEVVKIMPFGYVNGLIGGLNGQLNRCAMNVCAVKNCKSNLLLNNAQRVAKQNSTICYEVLTSVGMNNPRVYFYGDKHENNFG